MYPGPNHIIKCPSCGAFQQRQSLASGNNFGAVYYSDGNVMMPMLESYPYYVKCPSCGVFLKLSDTVVVGRIPWDHGSLLREKSHCTSEYPDEWAEAPDAEFLTINEYCRAIENGLCNSGAKDSEEWKKDILALRVALWRAFNDKIRNPKTDAESPETMGNSERAVYDANCRAILVVMADDFDDGSLLTKAEIYRNLGEFEQCVSSLSQIKDYDRYSPYITSIKKACIGKNMLTVRVLDWENVFVAAQYGEVEDIKYHIEKGINVNTKDEYGNTPLHFAARHNKNIEVIKYLVSERADINAKRRYGATPLSLAIGERNNDVALFLISQGADATTEGMLHAAAGGHNVEIIKLLVANGADIHAKDKYNYTPLHKAFLMGQMFMRETTMAILRSIR